MERKAFLNSGLQQRRNAHPQLDDNRHYGIAGCLLITDRVVPSGEDTPIENVLLRFTA